MPGLDKAAFPLIKLNSVQGSAAHCRVAGYTLLEMLIVMLLLGLLTGLAIPRLSALYDSMVAAYQRDDVIAQLNTLPYRSFQKRREFILQGVYPPADGQDSRLQLPEGWQIRAETPLYYRSNGVCEGGEVSLLYRGRLETIRLEAPFCQVGTSRGGT